MDGRCRAIAVGADAPGPWRAGTAGRLAAEVRAALVDEVIGTIRPDDVRLVTDASADPATVLGAVREAAAATTQDDALILYFCGAVRSPAGPVPGEVRLLTSGGGIDLLALSQEVLAAVPGAWTVVLDLVDTAAVPFPAGNLQPAGTRRLVDRIAGLCTSETGPRGAVLASVATAAVPGAPVVPGDLTADLLTALRGAAAGADGVVTVGDLMRHLERSGRPVDGGAAVSPVVERVLRVGGGRPSPAAVRLTSPGVLQDAGTESAQGLVPLQLASSVELTHPLDASAPLIRRLLDALFADAGPGLGRPGPTGMRERLERLRSALRAPSAGVIECGRGRRTVASWTDPVMGRATAGMVEELARAMGGGGKGDPGRIGRAVDGTQVLAVPLARTRDDVRLALVVVRPDPGMLGIGEPLSVVLREFVTPDPALRGDAEEMEIGVLTALRERFGLLPAQLYERTLERYRNRLSRLHMVYEPVVRLDADANRLDIQSWEALARRRERDRSAPIRLLDVADIWGGRFVVERDRVLATRALAGYVRAHAAGPWAQETPKPLAINVAVRSIMSDTYVAELREVIRASGLPTGGVTLEISEKDRIAPPPREIWLPSPMEYFRERIDRLAADLGVNFAVDDFGVGQASLDRLASLTITQIKIDRAILGHPLAREELRLVVHVAEQALREPGAASARPIVMEGVEPDAAVSLADIYGTGIRFVQGYIVGEMASTQLRPLELDQRVRIASLVARG